MNKLILVFLCVLICPALQASDATFEAVVRDKDFNVEIQQVTLTDLISSHSFDGEHFKIVQAKSDEAIPFDAEPQLLLKAATTYYHLTKARAYFVNQLNSEFVQSLDKTTIRIDIKNDFSELGHFANDNIEAKFNNARTVPGGTDLRNPDRSWGAEIWFRPSKKINFKDADKLPSSQNMSSILGEYRNTVHMISFQRFLTQLFVGEIVPSGTSNLEALFRVAGASILIESAYRSSDWLVGVFSRKHVWLETALVPEVIYHEYAHLALSDHFELTHSTPVNEGMADFFASQIANNSSLATKIKDYNTFSGKKAKNKKQYRLQFESTSYANTDFVFGLLWNLKPIVGKQHVGEFVYSLRYRIDTNASVREQLLESILQECRSRCESPNVQQLKMFRLFNSKGL